MTRPAIVAILLSVIALGCERPHSDMGQQDKALPYSSSTFFPDGATARPFVAGTIPRDDADVPGIPYAQRRVGGPAGFTQGVPDDASIPFPITAEVLNRGHVAFDAYCSVCHGRLGNGQGMIVQRGFTRPPSFHVDRLKTAPDSHIYNVITHGYGAMFGYAERVTPEQRWEIVAYVRALQLAPDTAGSTISDDTRRTLIAGGDRPASAPSGGGG